MQEFQSGPDESETLICPNCGELVAGPQFCQKCLCPIGATTNLDPIRTIQGEGFALRAGIRHAQSPYVFAGMWMIGLPVAIAPLWIVLFAGDLGRIETIAMLALQIPFATLYTLILYKATRIFFTKRDPVSMHSEQS